MPDNYIDISEQLREQRKECVRLRERAADMLKLVPPDSDLGVAMAELCKNLDLAINSIDVALK
jgi:hypothetical protein